MRLERAPLEMRLKLLDVANDVLDREGWVAGSLVCVNKHSEVLGWCAIGSIHKAAQEMGLVEPVDLVVTHPSDIFEWPEDVQLSPAILRNGQSVPVYEEVQDIMGWFDSSPVYDNNDINGREAAFEEARKLTD